MSVGFNELGLTTEPEWAYLAGILDGEGTITLSVRQNRKVFSATNRILIFNTNRDMIDWIQERFGGILRIHLREGHNNRDGRHESFGGKTVYRLDWANIPDILHILRGVIPYLTAKKVAAEMVEYLLTLPKEMEQERMETFKLIKEVQHG